MTKKIDEVHNSLRNSSLPEDDVELLIDWGRHRLAQGNSPATVRKYLYGFCSLAPVIDFSLETASVEQLEDLVRIINLNQIPGKEYSAPTQSQMKISIRLFYHWLDDTPDDESNPRTKFIETGVDRSEKKVWRKSDFVEADDVPELLDATTSARDHLLLETLWLSGGRISEVLNLVWSDVESGDETTTVKFRQSKSEPRVVHLPASAWQSFEAWREWHPDVDDQAPVFVSHGTGESLQRAQAAKIIDQAVADSDVDKDLSPHDFRRGRATYLAEEGWNEAKLMKQFGWSDPETPQRYVWLAESDIAEAVKDLPEN